MTSSSVDWGSPYEDAPCLAQATLVPRWGVARQPEVTLVCGRPKGHSGDHEAVAAEWTDPGPTTAGVKVTAGSARRGAVPPAGDRFSGGFAEPL